MKTITFFNNKGGVGKTSLVYHIAWMMQEMNLRVLVMDLDPQANLTTAFCDEQTLQDLWPSTEHTKTIIAPLGPLQKRLGDLGPAEVLWPAEGLALLPGDLQLGGLDDRLAEAWSRCLDDKPHEASDGLRVSSAFGRLAQRLDSEHGFDVCLMDVGPSIGPLNRAVLVATDYVVIPLAPDLFSLQGLENLGPTLREWRRGWNTRRNLDRPPLGFDLSRGAMHPMGYVLLNPSVRWNEPVKAYQRWIDRIPPVYARAVLDSDAPLVLPDPNMLSQIRHFKSLMPLAQARRKPMFALTQADGALGGHAAAVRECYDQFRDLTEVIMARIGAVGNWWTQRAVDEMARRVAQRPSNPEERGS